MKNDKIRKKLTDAELSDEAAGGIIAEQLRNSLCRSSSAGRFRRYVTRKKQPRPRQRNLSNGLAWKQPVRTAEMLAALEEQYMQK